MDKSTTILIVFGVLLIFFPFCMPDSGNDIEESDSVETASEEESDDINIDAVAKIKLTADVCLKLCEPILVDYFVPGYYIVDFANPGHEQVCNSKGCHEFDIACVCADSPTGLDVE